MRNMTMAFYERINYNRLCFDKPRQEARQGSSSHVVGGKATPGNHGAHDRQRMADVDRGSRAGRHNRLGPADASLENGGETWPG